MFGRKATLPLLPSIEVGNPKTYATQQWSNFLNKEIPIIHAKALENIKKAQEQQVQQYNKKIRELVKFKVGDLVLRQAEGGKLDPSWEGPYKVVKEIKHGAYKIQDLDGRFL